MNIGVVGQGYVGLTFSLCLAEMGHKVFAIEKDKKKYQLLKNKTSPITEKKIVDLTKKTILSGNYLIYSDLKNIEKPLDIIVVCVGTPQKKDGSLNSSYLINSIKDISSYIKKKHNKPTIVVRSTMLPGFSNDLLSRLLKDDLKEGRDFDYLYHPEFLREGSAYEDFFDPPKIVIGHNKESNKVKLEEIYKSFKDSLKIFTSLKEAETVKYVDNIFHALKVTFANEVGDFCNEFDIDSKEVMKIFKRDKKLNISDKYLNPGFSYGGSCLPKDLNSFLKKADQKGIDNFLLKNIKRSNDNRISKVAKEINKSGAKEIIFFGLAFKQGTNDLRNSPYLELLKKISSKSNNISVIDQFISYDDLKKYIDSSFLKKIKLIDFQKLEKYDLLIVAHELKNLSRIEKVAKKILYLN